ncbi:MAG: potassium channel family protein [Paraglaciecola sp.]|uniref:potassium channel family protein n=1 Tax=Paraglaciecola sp. TaxID=1920173 RepID=UPI0032971555
MSTDKTKFKVNKPHSKDFLTTRFGRFLDTISYFRLGLVTVLIWGLATVYFSVMTYHGHGMNIDIKCLDPIDSTLSAMYFSAVTLTTLGYGDISPLGAGRIVAVFLAITGLTIVAILIGKVSSERQSSLLLLLHTSDVERRMSSFTEEVNEYMDEIRSLSSNVELDSLHKNIKGLRALIESINKYMVFHINQSLFIEIGTNTSIKKLMNKFSECHDVIFGLKDISQKNKKIESATYSVSRKMSFIEDMLEANSVNKKSNSEAFNSRNLRMKHDEFTHWKKTTITESLLLSVHSKLPSVPRQEWPKHIHKSIAKDLEISNKLVVKCIDELKRRNLC